MWLHVFLTTCSIGALTPTADRSEDSRSTLNGSLVVREINSFIEMATCCTRARWSARLSARRSARPRCTQIRHGVVISDWGMQPFQGTCTQHSIDCVPHKCI